MASTAVSIFLLLALTVSLLTPIVETKTKKGGIGKRGTNHRNHHKPQQAQPPRPGAYGMSMGSMDGGGETCHACEEHAKRMKNFKCIDEYPHFLGRES